tara:strand:+ start:501 stop:701 length:201 start_codon:yes stop_codon:yes gene_type:complete
MVCYLNLDYRKVFHLLLHHQILQSHHQVGLLLSFLQNHLLLMLYKKQMNCPLQSLVLSDYRMAQVR